MSSPDILFPEELEKAKQDVQALRDALDEKNWSIEDQKRNAELRVLLGELEHAGFFRSRKIRRKIKKLFREKEREGKWLDQRPGNPRRKT